MNERTVAFVGAGVTILAWTIFWFGLVRAAAVTHPDSKTGDAFLKLIG